MLPLAQKTAKPRSARSSRKQARAFAPYCSRLASTNWTFTARHKLAQSARPRAASSAYRKSTFVGCPFTATNANASDTLRFLTTSRTPRDFCVSCSRASKLRKLASSAALCSTAFASVAVSNGAGFLCFSFTAAPVRLPPMLPEFSPRAIDERHVTREIVNAALQPRKQNSSWLQNAKGGPGRDDVSPNRVCLAALSPR